MEQDAFRVDETGQIERRGAPVAGMGIPAYWTAPQVAQLLAVKTSTLRTWMRRGQSPPYLKIGDTVRFDPHVVISWLEDKRVSNAEDRERAQPRSRPAQDNHIDDGWDEDSTQGGSR